ncbi:MAG: hypothetical protein ACR2KV_15105 [Solirubrobacteraceae bacterium]
MHTMVNQVVRRLMLGAVLGVCIAPAVAAAAPHGRSNPRVRATYPRRGAGFVGVSSQKSGKLALPVDLRAASNSHVMSRFEIQWAAACQGSAGRSYGGLSITLNKTITPHGVFTDGNTFTRAFSNGDKGLFTIRVYGRFTSPTRAGGTFRVTVAITNSAGAATNACDSGVITWSATD